MALLGAVLISPPAFGDEHPFTEGQAVKVDSDQAYILVRMFKKPCGLVCGNRYYAPLLIRALSEDELKRADALAKEDPDGWRDRIEPNVVVPRASKTYAEVGMEEFLLTSLKPGTYLLGGLAAIPGTLQASLCMGTVKFEAKPGVITDLGTIVNARNDEPTDIPELANVVMGKSMGDATFLEAVAIRPMTASTELPETLKSVPRVAADYHAVPPFPNYLTGPGIHRRHQHEARRVAHMGVGARHDGLAGLDRLAQRLQDCTLELRHYGANTPVPFWGRKPARAKSS
jgi:hypothetical protein